MIAIPSFYNTRRNCVICSNSCAQIKWVVEPGIQHHHQLPLLILCTEAFRNIFRCDPIVFITNT